MVLIFSKQLFRVIVILLIFYYNNAHALPCFLINEAKRKELKPKETFPQESKTIIKREEFCCAAAKDSYSVLVRFPFCCFIVNVGIV